MLAMGMGGCPTDPTGGDIVDDGGRNKNDVNPTPNPQPNPNPQPTPDPANVKRTFGAIRPPAEQINRLPQAFNPLASSKATLPASVDLSSAMPPVGDQAQLGSCAAWATAYDLATFNANTEKQWGAGSADHQASPAYQYAALIELEKGACGDGSGIKDGMDLLIKQGCPSLAAVPYSDKQCAQTTNNDGAFRIGSYNRVDPKDRSAVKAELAAGSVVVFGCELYTDFMTWTSADVFHGNGQFLAQGSQHAQHAMVVIGYDDARGAYRVQNSWGVSFGDQGRMWMAYDTFEATAFEAYSAVPNAKPQPGPQPQPQPQPEPGPAPDPNIPDLYINDGFQTVQWDWFDNAWVFLVFDYSFSEPVFVTDITGMDPMGQTSTQNIGMYFMDGYVYWVRGDGMQWMSGTYTLQFHVTTLDGVDVTYTGEMDVASLVGAGAKAKTINYRGRSVSLPNMAGAEKLQTAGMDAGALGANRQPVEFR